MVDAVLHLRGVGVERRSFAAVPRSGDLIDHGDGGLFKVDAVCFGVDAIDVFCIAVSDPRSAELRSEWSRWSELVDQPMADDTAEQQRLFDQV